MSSPCSSTSPSFGTTTGGYYGHRGPGIDVDESDNEDIGIRGNPFIAAGGLVHHTETCDTLLLLSDTAADSEAENAVYTTNDCEVSSPQTNDAAMSAKHDAAACDGSAWPMAFGHDGKGDVQFLIDGRTQSSANSGGRWWRRWSAAIPREDSRRGGKSRANITNDGHWSSSSNVVVVENESCVGARTTPSSHHPSVQRCDDFLLDYSRSDACNRNPAVGKNR